MPRFVVVIAVLAASGLGVVGSLWLRDEALGETQSASTPMWAPVAPDAEPIRQTLTFTVQRAPSLPLPAPAWTGTITAVNVSLGDVLDPASPAPVSVDGIARPWYPADSPLFRTLERNAVGPDVDALAQYLLDGGSTLDHEPGTALNASVVKAIQEWAVINGFGKNKSGFDTSWVTWLPTDRVGNTVSAVEARVGEPVPAAGAKLLVTGSDPTGLTIRDESGRLRPTPVVGAEDFLIIEAVEYSFADGRLDDAGLAALAAVLPSEQGEVALPLLHRFPDGSSSIPATALVPDGDVHCVVVSDTGTGVARTTKVVPVLGASAGVAVVADVAGFVLVNPGSLGVQSCS